MSTVKQTLTIRGIDVEVVYKDIKNLHVGVYPPTGRVRVAAPRLLGEDRVRLALIHRLSWIREQQRQFQDADRQSEREMVSGESHYAWGIRRRLSVIERPGRAHVELDHRRMLMYVPGGTSVQSRTKVLEQWQRDELLRAIPPLISDWEREIGRPVAFWGIRRMKTKWGSCNRETARIWLNLELAKKDPACLEYVVVHELAHLRERGHGEGFTALLDSLLPDWRTRRDTLNRSPLAEETWDSDGTALP